MAALARVRMARRFALCRHNADGPAGSSNVFCEYFGWEYADGVTVTDHQGRPVGWYTSLNSAHHHLTEKRSSPLWLVWLEPAPHFVAVTKNHAATEAAQYEPAPFLTTVAFLACGPDDARLQAIRLVEAAEEFLPEVQRHASMLGSVRHGTHSLFCPQPGCVKTSPHAGDHDIPSRTEPGHQPPKVDVDDLELTDQQRAAVDHVRQPDPTPPESSKRELSTAEAEAIANARASDKAPGRTPTPPSPPPADESSEAIDSNTSRDNGDDPPP